jgi:hypothetical protein
MKLTTLAIAALALGLSACAQVGGGSAGIIPGVLANDASILLAAATTCAPGQTTGNALAASQYRRAMEICSNPQAFVSALPPIPLSTISPAQEAQAIQFQCNSDGFTTAMPATVQVVTSCPTPAPAAKTS